MATLRMTRHLPRDPDTVFRFLTQQGHLLNWWGPEGTRIADHDLDFSHPGPWRATMVGPQGHGATVGGNVRQVDPPYAVELTLSFDMGADGRGPESVIRFELTATDVGTQLDLIQTGLDAAHIADMRDKGWNSALTRLEELIATA